MFICGIQAYLLLKKHGVDGLATGQDHHGESDGHRHHEANADHLRHQVGREVHQHVACNVLGETDIAKEAHLVQREMEGTGLVQLFKRKTQALFKHFQGT